MPQVLLKLIQALYTWIKTRFDGGSKYTHLLQLEGGQPMNICLIQQSAVVAQIVNKCVGWSIMPIATFWLLLITSIKLTCKASLSMCMCNLGGGGPYRRSPHYHTAAIHKKERECVIDFLSNWCHKKFHAFTFIPQGWMDTINCTRVCCVVLSTGSARVLTNSTLTHP